MNKEELKNFYQALFDSNEELVMQMIADEAQYILHGGLRYEGKADFAQMIKDMKESQMDYVEIENIVSDNQHAALNGILNLKSGAKMPFCEFVTFTEDRKILRIDSYVVAVDNAG